MKGTVQYLGKWVSCLYGKYEATASTRTGNGANIWVCPKVTKGGYVPDYFEDGLQRVKKHVSQNVYSTDYPLNVGVKSDMITC